MSTPSPVANLGPKKLARDAKILMDAGARIIPVGADKRPLFRWRRYRATAPTEEEITNWCRDPRTAGWAVLTGPVSGGWLGIDVEAAGMAYPQIIDPLKALPKTSLRRSQHKGAHAHVLIYDAPADYDWSGQVIARVRSKSTGQPVLLAEVRGDGQYIILTGHERPELPENFSPHRVSPEYFEQLIADGRALHDPTTSARKSLSAASAALAAGVKGKQVRGDTGDVLRQAVLEQPDLWPLLLDPGWTVLGTYPRYAQNKDGVWEDRVTLQRPDYGTGTEGESGNSLGPVLVNFSTAVPWWPEEKIGKGISAMHAVAYAWFDGDYAMATKAAETAAENLVLSGVAPDPAGAFGAWPHEVLEEVYAARKKSDERWQHQQATGGMGAPAAEGLPPDEAEEATPDNVRPLHSGDSTKPPPAQTPAEVTEAEIVKRTRDLRIDGTAKARIAEEVAADPDLTARALAMKTLDVVLYEKSRAAYRRSLLEEMAEGLTTVSGDDLFDEPDLEPIWGRDREVLWARNQPLHLFGPTGVGKSTIAQQLIRAALEPGGGEVFGWPVAPMESVLYLAADRPDQIKGLMRAHFLDLRMRGLLGKRLIVVPAAPVSPTGPPLEFRQWCSVQGVAHGWPERAAGMLGEGLVLPDLIVFDSLKDFIPNVNSAEDSSAYRRTVGLLVALGVQVLEMHHTNKSAAATGVDRGTGHTFLSAGAGSTIGIDGQPGALEVQVALLKPPMGEIAPFRVRHDRTAHVSTSLGQVATPAAQVVADPVLTAVGYAPPGTGWTITEIATYIHGPVPAGVPMSKWSDRKAVERSVIKLANMGLLVCVGGTIGAKYDPPRYCVTLPVQPPPL